MFVETERSGGRNPQEHGHEGTRDEGNPPPKAKHQRQADQPDDQQPEHPGDDRQRRGHRQVVVGARLGVDGDDAGRQRRAGRHRRDHQMTG